MSSNNNFPYNQHHAPSKNPPQYKPSLPSHNINQTFHQQPLAGGYVRPEYVAPQQWTPYSTSQPTYGSSQTASGGSGSVENSSGRNDGMTSTSQGQARATTTTTTPLAHHHNGIGARQASGAGTGAYDYVPAYSHESNYAQVSSAPSTSTESVQSQFRTTTTSQPQQYFGYSGVPQHSAANYAPAYQTTSAAPVHVSETQQTQPRVTKPSAQPRPYTSRAPVQVPEKPTSTYASYQAMQNIAPIFPQSQDHSLLVAAMNQTVSNNQQGPNAQSNPTTRSATPEVSYSSGPSYQKTNVQAASQQPLSMMRTQLPANPGRQTPTMPSSTQSQGREDMFRAVRQSKRNEDSGQNTSEGQDHRNHTPEYAQYQQEHHQKYQYQQQQAQTQAQTEARAQAHAQAEAQAAQAKAKVEAQIRAQTQVPKKPRKQAQGRTKQPKPVCQHPDQQHVIQHHQQQSHQQQDCQQPQQLLQSPQYRYHQSTGQRDPRPDEHQQPDIYTQQAPSEEASPQLPPLSRYHSEQQQQYGAQEAQQPQPQTYPASHLRNQNSTVDPSQCLPRYQQEHDQIPHETQSQQSIHYPQPQPILQPQPQQPSQTRSSPSHYPPQAQHVPQPVPQTTATPEPKPGNLGAIDPAILEQQMRDMVERMRYYQAQDPHTFQSVWDSVRKSSSSTSAIAGGGDDGHPKAIMPNTGISQERISNASSPRISSPLVRPVSVASIDRHVAEGDTPQASQSAPHKGYRGGTSNSHYPNTTVDNHFPLQSGRQHNLGSQPTPAQLPQFPQAIKQHPSPSAPSSAPASQVQTVWPQNPSPNISSASRNVLTRDTGTSVTDTPAKPKNTSKHGWDMEQKKRVARAVASYLCSISDRVISEGTIMELLDKNNHFVSLCEGLENRGFKFDRGVFARKLLEETSAANLAKAKEREGASCKGGARVLGEVDDTQEKDIQQRQQQDKPSLIVALPLAQAVVAPTQQTPASRPPIPRVTAEIPAPALPAPQLPSQPPLLIQPYTHAPSPAAVTKTPSPIVTPGTAPRRRGRPRKYFIDMPPGPPKTPTSQIIQQASLPTPPVTVTFDPQHNTTSSATLAESPFSTATSTPSLPLSISTSTPSLQQAPQLPTREISHNIASNDAYEIPRNPTPQSVRAAYTIPLHIPPTSEGQHKQQFVSPSQVFRTPTPPTPIIFSSLAAFAEPNDLQKSQPEMAPPKPKANSAYRTWRISPRLPAENKDQDDHQEARPGASGKLKSLVVKLRLPRWPQNKAGAAKNLSLEPFVQAPIDLTGTTPEPQPAGPPPAPDSAPTKSGEVQETNPATSEPSIKPQASKPEITFAVPPVSRIKRSSVGRKSEYKPETITSDLLRAVGRHPILPLLNARLLALRDNLPGYFGGFVDLTTIRWDILDPAPTPAFVGDDETEDEPDITGSGGAGRGPVGVVTSVTPLRRRRGRRKKGEVAPFPYPLQVSSAPVHRVRGRQRKGPAGLAKPITFSNASGGVGESLDGANSDGTSGSRGPADAPSNVSSLAGSPAPRRGQRPAVGASGLRNVSTPTDTSNIAVLIPPLSGASRSEYLEIAPINQRKRKSEERGDDSGRSGKAPKLSSKSAPSIEPSGFKVFECRWKHCRARLHNFENLRKHVMVAHKKLTAYQAYACLWVGCHRAPPEDMRAKAKALGTVLPDKISHDFHTAEEWEAHIHEHHLLAIREEIGLGPAVIPSDYESGISDVDYMSDRDGNPVTPLAVLAPSGYQFTPPPGYPMNRQFRIAHGIRSTRGGNTPVISREVEAVRGLAAGLTDAEKPVNDDDQGWKANQTPQVDDGDTKMAEAD